MIQIIKNIQIKKPNETYILTSKIFRNCVYKVISQVSADKSKSKNLNLKNFNKNS